MQQFPGDIQKMCKNLITLNRKFFLATLLITSFIFLGCEAKNGNEVKVYKKQKSSSTNSSMTNSENSSSQEVPSMVEENTTPMPKLTWKKPENWKENPASPMRLASYLIEGESEAGVVDISVFIFPGDVGGLLANINRWKGQLSQPHLTQEELDKEGQKINVAGHSGTAIRINGGYVGSMAKGMGTSKKEDYQMYGIYVFTPSGTIVLKAIGPKKMVEKHLPELEAFHQSFAFAK